MKTKVTPFLVVCFFCFVVLWLKLGWLQLIKGKEYQAFSQQNRIQIQSIPAPRGVIYDRKNEVLVRNRLSGREYLFPFVLAHVLGYVGEVSSEELPGSAYKLGDIVGKMGIEKEYDELLRGKNGGVLIEVDAQGQRIREIKKQDPQEGRNLSLTLDLSLQQQAFNLLKERPGAVIVTKPLSGETLALVSSPSFDPNLFTVKNELSAKQLSQLFNDPGQPLFNRAISGLYPPGSVFKIVTATAGLEEGKINKFTLIEDTGEIKIGDQYSFGNWYFRQYGKKEGELNLVKAIKRSNDIYFYKVGEWVGIDKLTEWSQYFGLGRPLGIDLPGEAAGLLPTPEWKKLEKTENWYLGDTYITAIGQGNLQLTPLQVNELAMVVANNGELCLPYLLKDKKPNCQKLKISDSNLALIKEGMREVCQKEGTAPIFADFKVKNKFLEVGCKTGTAEFGDPQAKKSHAWFTVFAPFDQPEIVVTVLVEGGGEGSQVSAPIAKDLLKFWFENN